MKTPKITSIGDTSVTFAASDGRALELKVAGTTLYGSLDLGGGDSSTVYASGEKAAADLAEFLGLLAAIEAGKAARVRLAELAGEFERDIRERDETAGDLS